MSEAMRYPNDHNGLLIGRPVIMYDRLQPRQFWGQVISPLEGDGFRTFGPRHGKHCRRGLTYASRVKIPKQRYRRSARGIASMPAVPSMFFHCGRWTLTKSPSDA